MNRVFNNYRPFAKVLWVTLLLLWGGVRPIHAYDSEACIVCHQPEGPASARSMDIRAFRESVHGRLACADCHTGVTDESHAETPGSGAVDCGQCHETENRHGLRAMGETRPKCHDCHTRHDIHRKSGSGGPIPTARLKQTCGKCHVAQTVAPGFWAFLASLKVSTHPKENLEWIHGRDNCIGCHQGAAVHGERGPVTPEPCHRCHMTSSGENPMWGYFHVYWDAGKRPGVIVAGILGQLLLVFLIWGSIRYHAGKRPASSNSKGA